MLVGLIEDLIEASKATSRNIELEKKVIIIFKNTSKYILNISEDELLEKFKRGDSSRSTEGNGLGLAIAKSIVELHNGKFEIKVDGDLLKLL